MTFLPQDIRSNQRMLLIPQKEQAAKDATTLPATFRAIELWANQPTIFISQITSNDGTVTITNPTGPVVDLHVTTGGGGTSYASLTGPGYTATPGNLTQAGGLTVNDTAGTMGLQVTAAGPVNITGNDATASPAAVVIGGSSVQIGYGTPNVTVSATEISVTSSDSVSIMGNGTGVTTATAGSGISSPNGLCVITGNASNVTGGGVLIGNNGAAGLLDYGFLAIGPLAGTSGSTQTHGAVALVAHSGPNPVPPQFYHAPGAISIGGDVVSGTTLSTSVGICQKTDYIGFFGGSTETGANTGIFYPQQTVTGAKGGNAALASVILALQHYGLIIDSSTA